MAKEQKRAAAAARSHAEERSRLQKEVMELTKARDSLKAQLEQAESRHASLARRAKLADEETARAKRSVERVSTAAEPPPPPRLPHVAGAVVAVAAKLVGIRCVCWRRIACVGRRSTSLLRRCCSCAPLRKTAR